MTRERKAYIWSILNALCTRGATFLFFVILGRLLGPSVFGIMAIALTVSLIVDSLSEHGFSTILVQRETLTDADLSTVYWFQLVVATVMALGVIAATPWLAGVFREPGLLLALPCMALTFVLNATGFVRQALLRRALRFQALAARNVLATLAGGVVGVVMVFAGYGLGGLIAMSVVNALVGAIVMWTATGWHPRWSFSFTALRPLHRSAASVASIQFLDLFVARMDQFLIGFFFGSATLGLYAFAIRLYDILMRVSGFAIAEAALPVLSRQQSDMPRYRETLLRLVTLGAGTTVPLFVLAAAVSPLLITVVFGAHWQEASVYANWLLFSGALLSIGIYNGLTFNALDKTRYRLGFMLANLVVWALCLPFLPLAGPVLLAAAWAIRGITLWPIQLRLMLRLTGMRWHEYWQVLSAILLAAAAMVCAVLPIVYLSQGWDAMRLMLAIMAGVSIYLGVLHAAGSPLPAEVVRFVSGHLARRRGSLVS